MSNIHVRNVEGVGPFALPTSGAMLDAATAEWQSILGLVPMLTYGSAYAMVVNAGNGNPEEQVLVVETWIYDHDCCKPESLVTQLRNALSNALNGNTFIASFGEIDINMLRQGAFYEQAPRIARLDRWSGTVYFEDRIPPGAQIEVYKFTKHPAAGDHEGGGGYPPRVGNRYRPDRLLAVGETSWTVPAMFQMLSHGRNHFKFAYRWPMPPNTPAPAVGIRGPLSPVGVSTASPGERTWGIRAILFPSPRSPKGSE